MNALNAQLALISKKLDLILQKEIRMASELDDLKAAVAAESAAVTQAATDMDAAVAKIMTVVGTGVLPADVEAAAVALQTTTAQLKAASTNLEAALNPAPAPVPPTNP